MCLYGVCPTVMFGYVYRCIDSANIYTTIKLLYYLINSSTNIIIISFRRLILKYYCSNQSRNINKKYFISMKLERNAVLNLNKMPSNMGILILNSIVIY